MTKEEMGTETKEIKRISTDCLIATSSKMLSDGIKEKKKEGWFPVGAPFTVVHKWGAIGYYQTVQKEIQ